MVEAVFPKVRDIVADVLVLEPEEINLHSRLIADLGAESIDFLDLVFQLEKEFDITIPRGKLEKDARGSLSDDEFERKGVITNKGMERLAIYFSECPKECFVTPIKVSEIPTLFTVETFCQLVVNSTAKQEKRQAEEATA